jgi:hypothetical protein
MAGLVPAIHELQKLIVEVSPFGVGFKDQTRTFPVRGQCFIVFSRGTVTRGRVALTRNVGKPVP